MHQLRNLTLLLLLLVLAAACQNNAPQGEATTAADAQTTTAAAGDTYRLVPASSFINWQGTEPVGDGHSGYLKISEGEIQVLDGAITGGSFVIDMNSITVTDLEGDRKGRLEGHLKDGDFFETNRFPTGRFVITQVEARAGDPSITHRISGNLTLRDSTKNINFPAHISLADGKLTARTPDFTINRTDWGVVYRSGLIGTIKDKLINDQIGLSVSFEALR